LSDLVFKDLLTRTDDVLEKSGAKKAKKRVDHLSEDAREAWETSQNPWVYRVSSVYDTLTQETPEAVAVAELMKLDPDFTLEGWRQDVVEHTLPQIMDWFLRGKINQLKPWLGEGVFKRIAAEITAREQEGVQIDTHVLGIMSSEILACEVSPCIYLEYSTAGWQRTASSQTRQYKFHKGAIVSYFLFSFSLQPDEVNKGAPIIVLHFMCQQINCVRKKKDGTILEGSEDDIRANSYIAAFQREYNEEAGELNWKIVDFRFNGAIAYL
jgi:import inner membrane translocase subunit TIM44